jgi:hypothetical protein
MGRLRRQSPVDAGRHLLGRLRDRWRLAALSVLAGLVVYTVAVVVFPYHSVNHDEAVYLQQAAMLLEGRLWISPPVPEAFQPWFFVRDGSRLYPKYQPPIAALFAPGVALGVPRVVLGLVAAGNAALLGLLVEEAYDRRTGLLAVGLFVASPLFVLDSATFLPYAPTTMLNLAFALAYVRAHRRGSIRYAVLAGLAVGLAFFARPYTAILFAAPFVGHALVVSVLAVREREGWTIVRSGRGRAPALRRNLVVAALGSGFVGLTLAYNAVMTGSPWLFPFEAFAPLDGIGFGRRALRSYDRDYTPALALRANARVLWRFATHWSAVAPFGTVVALVGAAGAVAGARRTESLTRAGVSPSTLRLLLVGVAGSVIVGNVYFWGSLNILGSLSDPTDGLISVVGTYYHFDLLVPFAAFGAAGALSVWGRLRAFVDANTTRWPAGRILLAVLVITVPVAAAAEANALGPPLARNLEHTERYERVYEPVDGREFSDALVFVPTPYGDWLAHPFQTLRNDPGLDGPVVYALNRGPDSNAAVLSAFPNRTVYRYTYRGTWAGTDDGSNLHPRLYRLSTPTAQHHRVTTRVGRPNAVETVTLSLSTDDRTVRYGLPNASGSTQTVEWVLNESTARLAAPDDVVRYSPNASVPIDGPTEVTLAITYLQYGGASITYRQELTVVPTSEGLRVVWPPEREVCELTSDCGNEGTYVSGVDDYPAGVSMNATITSSNRSVPAG